MLIIRFQRIGRKNDPSYRMVVTERRSKPQSGGIETVGSYHPKTKHTVFKNERILYWMAKGAGVSDTVHNLLVANGTLKAKKRSIKGQAAKKAPEKEILAPEAASVPTP